VVLVVMAAACNYSLPRLSGDGGGGGRDGGRRDGGSGRHDGGGDGGGRVPDANCGTFQSPEGAVLDLPDGVCGNGLDSSCSCTSSATQLGVGQLTSTCTAMQPSGELCWNVGSGVPGGPAECRESNASTVVLSSFASGQAVMQASDIVSVCVNMSHEWVRDLEMDLVSPNGQVMALDRFQGQGGSGVVEVYLGHPRSTDGDCVGCTTESGIEYCWSPTATNPTMLAYANTIGATFDCWDGSSTSCASSGSHRVLPAGTYAADDPWTNLVGATLNGTWTFRVVDLVPQDAGKLHGWAISFNESLVQGCSMNPTH
jgi:subtilisin-like proprotein convertase family protein